MSICHGGTGLGSRGQSNSTSGSSQHACSSLCDEIVVLWRLAALNPRLSPQERDDMSKQFKDWHLKTIDKVLCHFFMIEVFAVVVDRQEKSWW